MLIKALTIHQPWASLIVAGLKAVENRSWPTHHRGPLLIHAGQSRQSWKVARAVPEIRAELERRGWNDPKTLPAGFSREQHR